MIYTGGFIIHSATDSVDQLPKFFSISLVFFAFILVEHLFGMSNGLFKRSIVCLIMYDRCCVTISLQSFTVQSFTFVNATF